MLKYYFTYLHRCCNRDMGIARHCLNQRYILEVIIGSRNVPSNSRVQVLFPQSPFPLSFLPCTVTIHHELSYIRYHSINFKITNFDSIYLKTLIIYYGTFIKQIYVIKIKVYTYVCNMNQLVNILTSEFFISIAGMFSVTAGIGVRFSGFILF